MSAGTLYGLGVGPGDPDLLTMKAVKVLGRMDVVFAAGSTKNAHSISLDIATPHLKADVDVRLLKFPMTKDIDALEAAWRKNAEVVMAVLDDGLNAAFLTLGDPLLYSTFGYLARTLGEMRPELTIEAVPGITSFQAAAAKTMTVLAENEETFSVIPGIRSEDDLRALLQVGDSAVVLKTYRNFPAVRRALAGLGLDEDAVFVSRLGLAGESVHRGLQVVPDKPEYLSLALVTKRRGTLK